MTISPPEPGIYTPLPTFFKKDSYTLDIDTQIAHAKYLKSCGIKGIVVFGSTGELTHVTRAERFKVVKALRDAIPNYTIAAGVTQGSVVECLEEIDSLKEAGAEYAMVIPSSYFGPVMTPQSGVVSWFKQVADKSSLPILIYCFPAVSNGFDISVDSLIELSAHPNIVGAKFSHGNVSTHAMIAADEEVIANNFSVFTGLGQVLLPVLTLNVKGTIDALSGAFPKTILKIYDLYQQGDIKSAAPIQSKFSKAEEIIARFGPRGAKKCIQLSQGIAETYQGRAPMDQEISAAEWKKYEKAFNDVLEIEKSL